MHDIRMGANATLLNNGKILVAGGMAVAMNSRTGSLGAWSSELYDIQTDTWTVIEPTPDKRQTFPLFKGNNSFSFRFNNSRRGVARTEHRYYHNDLWHMYSNTPRPQASLLMQQAYAQTILLEDGCVLLIGGINADRSSLTDAVQMYVP